MRSRLFRLRFAAAIYFVFSSLCLTLQATEESKQQQQSGRAFVQQLADGHFAQATDRFDATMRSALNAEQLESAWKREVTQSGALQTIESVRQRAFDDHVVVELTCAMERGRIVIRMSFDGDEHVSGLFFRPAPPPRDPATTVSVETPTGTLYGTVDLPAGDGPFPVLLVIAGSGPTDRDGNNATLKNNCLKQLGGGLSEQGIAVVRYDKRGIGESLLAGTKEEEMNFDMMVADVVAWMEELRGDKRFSHVGILGHSEGALMGTMAAQQTPVDCLVLVAGPGRPAGDLIREQLADQLTDSLNADNERILAALQGGHTVDDVPSQLATLYRRSVQPYLISWMRLDPATELSHVTVPVMIVQGKQDIQVREHYAELLAKAQPNARLLVIDDMNHVFKRVRNPLEQQLAYLIGLTPLAESLVPEISKFVNEHIGQK